MRRSIPSLVAVVILLVGVQRLHAQQQAQFLMPMFDDKGAPVKTFAPSDLTVFEDGKEVKVLKGLPMGLDQAAAEAVKKWRFKPATLNGKPVDVYYNLTVNFTLQ